MFDTIKNKIVVQTSKYKPEVLKNTNIEKFAKGWDYVHFDDNEIIKFFKENPIFEFQNIEKRFYEIKRGEHRADLFRYYYIYLNGGFFIDSDFELNEHLDTVVSGYDFVSAQMKSWDSSINNVTNRSRLFNGYLYATQKHPIILQALRHLYHIDLDDLGPRDGSFDRRYHVVCEYLYSAQLAYPHKNKIKIYQEVDNPNKYKNPVILDGDKILGHHLSVGKENVNLNSTNPILFFCQRTVETPYNSGIQRHVRQMAKGLLENGVRLIPIKLNKLKQFEILSEDELKVLSQFDGPAVDSWTHNRNFNSRESVKYFRQANFIIYPELQNNRIKEIKRILVCSKIHNLKIISIFHDAVPIVLKDYYSSSHAEIFLEYMNDLSQSDFMFSVSESSNKDYKQLVSKPKNPKLKNIALLSPHNIKEGNEFVPKINNTKEIEVLFVSSVVTRKNHVNFLKAYSIAQKKIQSAGYNINLSLIAADVGVPENYLKELNVLISETNTKFKVNVSEEDLKKAYKNADFTVYPSVYEGYGLPIVESLSAKTPVACSNTSSMKEIAELGGCITFDPYNIDDMANAIVLLATDSKKRNSLVKEIESIKEYSWKDYALNILKTIAY